MAKRIPTKGSIVSVVFDGITRAGRVEDTMLEETRLFVRFPDGEAAWLHSDDVRTAGGGRGAEDEDL